jgi:hypothetical protein
MTIIKKRAATCCCNNACTHTDDSCCGGATARRVRPLNDRLVFMGDDPFSIPSQPSVTLPGESGTSSITGAVGGRVGAAPTGVSWPTQSNTATDIFSGISKVLVGGIQGAQASNALMSQQQMYYMQQQQQQRQMQMLLLLGAVGVGAYLLLGRD